MTKMYLTNNLIDSEILSLRKTLESKGIMILTILNLKYNNN